MLRVAHEVNSRHCFARLVEGKRVILVGPSKCATLNTVEFVESHDLVVRVNYSWPVISELQPAIGSRLDILYHNSAGLRPISEILIPSMANTKFVWYDRNRNMFHIRRFLRQYGVPGALIRPFREGVSADLGTHPNEGTLAILHLLTFNIASLHVTGITFFREPYQAGYPETKFGNQELIKTRRTPAHDADIQLRYFATQIYGRDTRLTVDETLARIVYEDLRSTNG